MLLRPFGIPLKISIPFVLIFVFYISEAQTVVRVEANQPPKLETVLSDSLFSMTGTGYVFGANLTLTGGTSPFRYSWMKDNQIISTSAVLEIPSSTITAGVYSLTVKDSRNCSVTLITTGINDYSDQNESIRVFPVPARDQITVDPGTFKEELVVSISDYSGKVMLNRRITGISVIELRVPGGVYQLKIGTLRGKVVAIKKIVVL